MGKTVTVYRGSKDGVIHSEQNKVTLEPNDVFVEITHSGVCGADELFLKSGIVLGHEGIGIIRQIGKNVTTVKIGDRVGFSFVQKVCGSCHNCLSGRDHYCIKKKQYGQDLPASGSFSHGAVRDASCIYAIPDGYPSEYAAPLMCAGATVWNVLTSNNIRPGDRVGVMGIGGLGHLAIKLGAAMGYQMVAISSKNKHDEAIELGASEHYVRDQMDQTGGDFRLLKHLILSGSPDTDYQKILSFMDTDGAIYPLTSAQKAAPISLSSLNTRGIRIQGSMVAPRYSIQSLLQFAAAKSIYPRVMTFPLDKEGIEQALQELRDGNMRYRGVLVRGL
ncbi:hypothetical protein BDV24DRAFT_163086 [Aspergillus arachidicola]|uniref:Enoyl reductase (ER) domain-containing protein n=1 Tax=Aspergillus arachidicola TaxID=656916 RepID=A0A5N6Y8R5_9EURO|nr:hypothetical protein BDV24DRAFT_163086 [Aspergillus arachidicola]